MQSWFPYDLTQYSYILGVSLSCCVYTSMNNKPIYTYLGANYLVPETNAMSSRSSELEAEVVHIHIRIRTCKQVELYRKCLY